MIHIISIIILNDPWQFLAIPFESSLARSQALQPCQHDSQNAACQNAAQAMSGLCWAELG